MRDKRKALARHLGIKIKQVEQGWDENNYTCDEGEYLVVTDDEADELWEEDLENYIDECILPKIDGSLARYFDREAWKSDARYDGRGHSLNHYDGEEHEETVNGTTYYIYRTN